MNEPIISPRARRDLGEAWEYLSERSPSAADRLIKKFGKAVKMHASFPESGRPREEFGKGVRSFVVYPYVVFYRAVGETIEVARVLHGRRDIDRIMREDEI
jgi:plasmid stabilization system protein ParE